MSLPPRIPSSPHEIVIDRLQREYSGASMFRGRSIVALNILDKFVYNGFLSSKSAVSITSRNEIVLEASACIAAPIVVMVAKNAISMGVSGQGLESSPVRVFAPNQLLIITKHLRMCDFALLTNPSIGFVFCRKLTLLKSTEEDPGYFEIVKSFGSSE